MANLRDSGSIEQDADIIGLLHRVGYTDNTNSEALIDFLLEKARNGTTGEIHMVFKPSYMRFKEVEK
jgi:replicative DNA helicase